MSGLRISCSTYTGTLAVLTTLVLNGSIDVYSLSLAQVAEQVVAAILDPDSPLSVDDAGAELVLCAGLLRHKSKSMLPAREDCELAVALDEPEGDRSSPAVWFASQDYKADADALEDLALQASRLYARGMVETKVSGPPVLQTSLMSLVLALQHMLEQARTLTMEIPPQEYTVSEAILYLEGMFSGQARVRVVDLFPQGSSRLHIIVVFLGLLELIKLGRVELMDSECGELILCSQEEGRVA
ncbi:MAG: Segregation and condensation protein A [Firmicutes bacterium]|nr:Segregation and condensation protein A [candidate division NPL-UPA2 bacterium]MBT9153469.1 Segregation and condensation protein A [candidate division NPL-UPA2 bacterium]MBT9155846.1 Segregation and condensation protein A [candidate division NPL-UPA2 bacterium]